MPRFQCSILKWYMPTIKNGQILLYCHFNKIIEELVCNRQHSAENMLEMFVIQHTSI